MQLYTLSESICQKQGFVNTSWKLFSRGALIHMKTRVSLKYIVSYSLWKHFFDSNLLQTPSNVISFNFLVTLLSLFQATIRAIKWEKSPKIWLTWLLLSWFFHCDWNLALKEFQVCFRTCFRKKNKSLVKIWLVLINLRGNKSIISKRNFCRQSIS